MNNRKYLLKVNKRKKFYSFIIVRVREEVKDLDNIYWSKNSWNYFENGYWFYIINEKHNYIKHTLLQVLKILKNNNILVFKLK